MDFYRLAAVSYNDPDRPGQKIIRVYYQVGTQIRESCYDADNGWYVRGDNVVANHSKPRSPIAVTNLAQGKKVRDDSSTLYTRAHLTTDIRILLERGQSALPGTLRCDSVEATMLIISPARPHNCKGSG